MRLAATARPNAKRITEAALAVALVLMLYVFVVSNRSHRQPGIDVTFKYKHVIALDKEGKETPLSTLKEEVVDETKKTTKKRKKKKGLELDENGQYDHEEVRKVIAQGYSSQKRFGTQLSLVVALREYTIFFLNCYPTCSQTKSVNMQHCPCTRDIEVPSDSYSTSVSTDGLPYDLSNTTCSSDAFLRGSGQKVVGFSFYGDLNSDKMKIKGYFEGIVGNLELMRTFYPGWTMRLYFDLDDSHPAKKVHIFMS